MSRSGTRSLAGSWWPLALGGMMAAVAAWGLGAVAAADRSKSSKEEKLTPKEALAEFNDLIGDWRGVGLPKRGSRDGAWTETAAWVWEFDEGVGIRYEIADGQLLKTALLTWEPEAGTYRLATEWTDGSKRTYSGKLDDGKLVLETEPDDAGEVHRVAVTRLNEKRTLVLFEKRRESSSFYTRIAEVGYTRQGTSLAEDGVGGPECVVTGGRGTIEVMFEGETYYVCCTGCQQAFDNDPAGTIAEYKEKLAERRARK